MALNYPKQINGINLVPQNTITPNALGDMRYNSDTDEFEVFKGTLDTIVTASAAGVLDNKTLTNTTIGSSDAALIANTLKFTELLGQPSTNPPAGELALYAKGDGLVYKLDSSGVESPISVPTIAAHTILANITGSTAAPVGNSLTSVIDSSITNVQGSILYRNATQWTSLSPGTNGQLLSTGGAAANPSWINAPATGANTALSNLTATAINQSLVPNANLTLNVGSAANRFVSIFSGAAKDSSSVNQIDLTNRQLTDSTGAVSVDWQGHQLRNSAGLIAVDWTNGTLATTHQVELKGATSGSIFLGAPSVVSSYSFTLPASLGSNGQVLTISGGNSIWATPAASTGITPTQLDSLSSGNYLTESSSSGIFSTSSTTNVVVLPTTSTGSIATTRPMFINFAWDGNNPASINVAGGVATFTLELMSGLTIADTINIMSLGAGTYPPSILDSMYPHQSLTGISGTSVRLRVRMSSGSVTVSNTTMTVFQV